MSKGMVQICVWIWVWYGFGYGYGNVMIWIWVCYGYGYRYGYGYGYGRDMGTSKCERQRASSSLLLILLLKNVQVCSTWTHKKCAALDGVKNDVYAERSFKNDRNRQFLKTIAECLLHTAQQNTAQRGHEEKSDDTVSASDINRGNFLELLHLHSKHIQWLEDRLKSNLGNMLSGLFLVFRMNYSRSLQTSFLVALRKIVASEHYGIIVDETSDISRTEQVSICLSFLNKVKKREAFVGFYETKTTDGEALFALVTKAIGDLNLDIRNCWWEAEKSVHEQIEIIVKALIQLADDKDPKTYSDSRALLSEICDFEFILGLCILKVILLNTNSLSRYLQPKIMDVITARRNADLTIRTLGECRNNDSFGKICQKADQISQNQNIKSWIENTRFDFCDARIPRRNPSCRLQVGELTGMDAQPVLTPVQHHCVNIYYSSIDKVLSELEVRFKGNDQAVLCAFGAIAISDSQSDYELIENFYGLDKDLMEAEQRLFPKFKQRL
ncbi:zinc finger MYM-type protein 1-like [Macrobrachium rosenbergii]|uniref:zinc finger MYM-type protein 1-like n=1 Tax=Macrobrachium rosenbergii TaxID=79674 RepID=UPI0034D3C3E4